MLAAGAAAFYVHIQSRRDARQAAQADARFAADTAAKQLGDSVALLQATVKGLAANPQAGNTIDHPTGCSLTYSLGGGPRDRGHVDLLQSSGAVVCSSRARPASGRFPTYAGRSWVRQARRGPIFLAPVLDSVTGAHVVISAAPVPGHGIVAGLADLGVIGPQLASLYGGGHPIEFLLTSSDGRTVIARSIEPDRWIGSSLAGTAFARGGRGELRDLNGTTRFYEAAPVPGTGWRLFAGEEMTAALAAGGRLQSRQLQIILAGLAAVLLATLLAYRRVAKPISDLGAAVRSSSEAQSRTPVRIAGPAEVVALADDVNGLISSVNRELVERERAEESYRLLFNRHPGPMWVFDAETLRFLAVNDAAVAAYGYSAEEFLAMTIEEIRPVEDRAALREVVEDASRMRVDAGIWKHVRKDGSLIDVSVWSNTIDFEGRPARLVLAQDVTEQRRLEEQLRQAQKMEAIGSLAGGVAHDFNNILMVIRTCSALLLKQVEDGQRANVIQIDNAAQRAADLTHQLLAFSRQQVLRLETTDVNGAVEDTLELLHRLIGENIEIVRELEPKLESIVVDRGQLVQVILNLGVNARDAMGTGGRLTIRTANVELDDAYATQHVDVAPGRYVLLQVTDSGEGMDDETKRHIFDPFFTTKGEGTGLGLATVYGIVKQSGGHIWLYSEAGMGTTFKVYFPTASLPASPAVDEPAGGSLAGRETVLLVEDEEVIRVLVAEALRAYGYTVIEAAHAAQAVEIAGRARQSIDLLLTDVVMPGMNGRELAERLVAGRPTLKVLFTSGYPADTIIRQGIAQARTNYIEKPYLPDDLARKIRDVLDAKAA